MKEVICEKQQPIEQTSSSFEVIICTRAVHKETEHFLLIYWSTYNLIKLVSFNVLPSTLDTPRPTLFFRSGTSPGTCFAGWREGPLSNFLLSPLPSEIADLLGRILTSGTRKSLHGPNLFGFFMDCLRICKICGYVCNNAL